MKTNKLVKQVCTSLVLSTFMFCGNASAENDATITNGCISFKSAQEFENKSKENENKYKNELDTEQENKKHEDESKNFEEHKVPVGSTACTTTSGLPGFIPRGINSRKAPKIYREIHGL